MALEVTEVLFPTLIENEINVDVFLKEFNDNLIYLIYELLNNEYDKFLITDMFTNFSVLMLNNNKNSCYNFFQVIHLLFSFYSLTIVIYKFLKK